MNEDVIVVPKEWWKSKTDVPGRRGRHPARAGAGPGADLRMGHPLGGAGRAALAVGSITAIGLRTASQPIGNPGQPLPAIPVVASTEAVAVPAGGEEILPTEGVIQPRPGDGER